MLNDIRWQSKESRGTASYRADVSWGANAGVWARVEVHVLAEAEVGELQNWHWPTGSRLLCLDQSVLQL